MPWAVPIAFSAQACQGATRLHRMGKCSVLLRDMRPTLCDARCEAEVAKADQPPRGPAPLPLALLAKVRLVQASKPVGEAEAVVTASLDQRWPRV